METRAYDRLISFGWDVLRPESYEDPWWWGKATNGACVSKHAMWMAAGRAVLHRCRLSFLLECLELKCLATKLETVGRH